MDKEKIVRIIVGILIAGVICFAAYEAKQKMEPKKPITIVVQSADVAAHPDVIVSCDQLQCPTGQTCVEDNQTLGCK